MTDTKKNGLWDAYDTDATLEEEGAWVELRAGVKVKVRSENSAKARQFASTMAKQQRHILQTHNWVLPPDLADKNEVRLCAKVLVADWEGVTDRDGNPLPYSQENVERVVTALPRFRQDILYAARTDETFKTVRDDMAGNSGAPSKANSPTAAVAS